MGGFGTLFSIKKEELIKKQACDNLLSLQGYRPDKCNKLKKNLLFSLNAL